VTLGEINLFAVAWTVLAVVLVPAMLWVTAPYGRHVRPGWGPMMQSRAGWMLMEGASLLLFVALFLIGGTAKTAPMWVFFALWVAHYVNRSLIFPLRMKKRDMPVVIVAMGVVFGVVNGGLNGGYLGFQSAAYPDSWFADPRFLIGLGLFFVGAAINLSADQTLLALRRPGAPDYSIPRDGLFRFVSCPNHFGEIVEWTGFAIMCWNLPALSFAVWTAANLIPRSLSHDRWYRERFPDYPRERKAVIPVVL
jgi:3-oxo-5-alpha-steroid 4-dehydrogenase 1